MEVLPAFVVVLVGLAWLWARHRRKQVTAPVPQRGGADAPSPREEGRSEHLALRWAGSDGGQGLRPHDPATGEPVDEERARLESDRFEVADVVDVDVGALRRDAVEPGVPVLVQRPGERRDAVEVRAADTGDELGRLASAPARRIGEQMARGRRVEGLVLRERPGSDGPSVAVLVTDRGVLPPVPDAPRS